MTALDPNRLIGATAQGLAADAHSLDALKRTASRDPKAALKGAAQQFEALFLQMVLKSMRDAVPKSGLLDSDSEQMYTGLLDQQLATQISKSGTGLADIITRQLAHYLPDGQGADPKTSQSAPQSPPKSAPGASATPTVPAKTALDRYAEIAAANPNSALREAELHRTNAAARAAYLDKRDGATGPSTVAPVSTSTDATAVDASSDSNGDPTNRAQQQAFVTDMWQHATAAQQATGIPALFVVAQAALESGWGKREIRDSSGFPTYNLFGVKAGSGWQGRTVDVVTTEYENGVARKVTEKFRAYNSYADAFRDWAQLIGGNRRYSEVVQAGRTDNNAAGFAHGLARAGYATDPDYGAKLVRVIGSIATKPAGSS